MDLAPDVVTVALTRADGGLTIRRIVQTEYRAPKAEEIAEGITQKVVSWSVEVTPEYVEEGIRKKGRTGLEAVVSWRFVPNDFVDDNTDRFFRNAWKDTPGLNKPDHDMVKARELQRENIRRHRAQLMDALDTEYLKADERGDKAKKDQIVAYKQALRDAPSDPRLEAAQTVEELKPLTLETLAPAAVTAAKGT